MNESMKLIKKHGYSLMIRDARGANFRSRDRIYANRGAILGPQGRNFLTMLAPGAGPAK